MRQYSIDLPTKLVQCLFNSGLDCIRWLFVRKPMKIALEPVPLIYRVSTTDSNRSIPLQIVHFTVLGKKQIRKFLFRIDSTTVPLVFLMVIRDPGRIS